MTRMTESTRSRGFRRTLVAGAFGAAALAVTAGPAVADTLGYYYDGPPTVYTAPTTTTTTTTYTYTTPTYTYSAPPPAYVYERERRHGIYLETPVLNFGIGIHHDDD